MSPSTELVDCPAQGHRIFVGEKQHVLVEIVTKVGRLTSVRASLDGRDCEDGAMICLEPSRLK